MRSKERLIEDLNQARLVNISAGVIYPLLEKHEEEKVSAMCAKFTNGETNFLADVASLAYIRELKRSLEVKQKQGESAAKVMNLDHKED